MVDEIDYWFEAGWAVLKEEQWDADFFPPLNDMEAGLQSGRQLSTANPFYPARAGWVRDRGLELRVIRK
jgi:hypothetical protein